MTTSEKRRFFLRKQESKPNFKKVMSSGFFAFAIDTEPIPVKSFVITAVAGIIVAAGLVVLVIAVPVVDVVQNAAQHWLRPRVIFNKKCWLFQIAWPLINMV